MAGKRELKVVILGDASGAQKAFSDIERASTGIGSKLASAAKVATAAVATAGAAVVGVATRSVAAFSGFQRQMNEVFTLLPGISAQAMDQMTGQVKDFSKEFGALPDEVVPALYQALSAGVPRDNVFEFLEVAQKAAKGGITELTTAVDGISSVVNAYGADVLGASQASDLLFTAVRLGKTNFEELSSSIFQVAPIASALGVEFGDVTASIAALTAKGTPTSVAMTQVRGALAELGKEGTKASSAFQDAAGVGFTEFIAKGGNLADALELMERHASAGGQSVLDLFGSVEAGQAALALTGEGMAGFRSALDEMGQSAGATEAAFTQMEKGLGPVVDKIKARLRVGLLDLGEQLAPAVETVANVLLTGLEKASVGLSALFAAFREGDVTSDGFVGALERAGVALRELLDRAREVFAGIRDGTGSFGEWRDALALLGGPMGIIVRQLLPALQPLLAAIITPLAQIANQVGPVLVGLFAELAQTLLPILVAVLEGLTAVLEEHPDLVLAVAAAWGAWKIGSIVTRLAGLAGGIGKVTKAFGVMKAAMLANPYVALAAATAALVVLVIANWDTIVGFLSDAWEAIKGAAGAAWDWVTDRISQAVDVIVGLFLNFTLPGLLIKHWDTIRSTAAGAWRAITGVLSTAWSAISTSATAVWGGITGFFSTVWDGVAGAWRSVWGGIGDFFSGIWEGIKTAAITAINWIIDRVNTLIDGINSVSGLLDKVTPGDTFGEVGHIPRVGPGRGDGSGPTMPISGIFDDGGIVPGPTGSPQLILAHGGETVLPTHKQFAERSEGLTKIVVMLDGRRVGESRAVRSGMASAIVVRERNGGML